MKLVVAEKPSVAQSLAAVLGAKEKKDGYLEGGGWLVSWCVGHLVELAQPEAYGEQYAKWRYADLPILPAHWKYDVSKDKKKQLGVLHRLMEDKRVDAVVCATDAGREGELIFRLVYQQAGCSKPILRLWISSMEDAAIRDGFEHLRPGEDYDLLYRAALCRAGADWLVVINATRLFSVLYGDTLNVGRVMTPTLALIVQREDAIRSFQSKPFYVPELKHKTGLEQEVVDFVMRHPEAQELLKRYEHFLEYALPLYVKEGKSQLTIAVGCTGGKHRSITFARKIAEYCRMLGYEPGVQHRDSTR